MFVIDRSENKYAEISSSCAQFVSTHYYDVLFKHNRDPSYLGYIIFLKIAFYVYLPTNVDDRNAENLCAPWMTVRQLAPEQKKALEMLHSKMGVWSSHFVEKLPMDRMLQQGFCAFSNRCFDNLPHGDTWTWNKSGGKAQVQLDGTTMVSLYKMNARRKSTSFIAPHFKVWIFALALTRREPHLHFYWCENGISNNSPSNAMANPPSQPVFRPVMATVPRQPTPQPPTAPGRWEDLVCSDFAFLAPHTEPAIARELGWI